MPTQVFISYSHDSESHSGRVLWLAETLREFGIDAEIDQYHQSPDIGWPRWMLDRIQWATYVLIVCTRTYHSRFNGTDQVGTGKGAKWEGAIVTQSLYDSESRNRKFVPLLFDDGDEGDIPLPLRGFTHYRVLERQISSIDALYRHLTNQPIITKRPIGDVMHRPRRQVPPPKDAGFQDATYEAANEEVGNGSGGWNDSVSTAVGVYSVDIHIDAEFDSFDETKQKKVLEAIKLLFDSSDDIKIVRKRKGSVILTIELDPARAERLKWAVLSGELSSLGVFDAVLTENKNVSGFSQPSEHGVVLDFGNVAVVDTITSVYQLRPFASKEAAEIFETIESVLRSCIDRGVPLESHSRKIGLFECFREAARLGLLETRASDLLSSELVIRRIADRWNLPTDIAHSIANGYDLAPIYLARLRILWSFARTWTEWAYAFKGLRKASKKQ